MRLIHAAAAAILSMSLGLPFASCNKAAEPNTLVILHTNDTHSQIEPDAKDAGGVMRRKAVIDSIRGAEKNVLLVDAGDAVQGTLYFYLYGGEVEQEIMNILGVEERILGNHEFDNGIDSLAAMWKLSNAEKLASNYNLDDTPLAGMFKPYSIKEYGGKKIGLIGINLDPEGIITPGNYDGLKFEPIIATANVMAEKLKKEEGVDAVIALSHIGYNPSPLVGDSALAVNSRNIDIIIGGHSHDVIDPKTPQGAARSRLTNLDGKEVLVVQTGKAGRKLGKIEINLDSLGLGGRPAYELIDIDSRYDGKTDPVLEATINKYKHGVDSLMTLWVGSTERELKNSEPEMLNIFSDWIYDRGSELAPGVDLSIANKGGLRADLPEGKFSKGQIINILPFRNYVTVIDVKGSDLRSVFDVMAKTDGNGVSRNVSVTYDTIGGRENYAARDILISGRPLNDNKTYRGATIDYLAKGGDYMRGLTKGELVKESPNAVFDDLLFYLTEGKGKNKPFAGERDNRWNIAK